MKSMFTFDLSIIILGVNSYVGLLNATGQSSTILAPTNPPSSDTNLGHLSVQFEIGSNKKKIMSVVKVSEL